MRSTAVRALTEVASAGADLHLLTADLGFKVLDPFRESHPTRFTNVGVSEANMIGVASGLALLGKRPVCYSMVPFLFMRAFEQVRLDVVAARLPVVLLGVGGGLSYGSEGTSHHAFEDLAMARALPGLRVIAPGDPLETDAAVRLSLRSDGPTFIRLGKNGDPRLHTGAVDVTRPITMTHPESRIVVFATGHILAAALEAAKSLEPTLRVRCVSVPMLKPFDRGTARDIVRDAEVVVTIEEHSVVGGLGSEIAELLLESGYRGRFRKLGLPDTYCTTHGTLEWLRGKYGLDPSGLARQIREVVDG